MDPKDADWLANSVDPDQTVPLGVWVYTGCQGLSVRKHRIIMVHNECLKTALSNF